MDEEKTISAEVTKEKKGKPDRYLVGVYITLLIFGIIEAFSASSREIAVAGNIYEPIAKHILFLLIGTVLMIWISKKEVTQFIKPSLIFVGLTFVFLIVTMFFGSSVNGAQRGFSLLGFTVQPAELSKVAIVFILAYILAITMNKKEVNRIGIITCVAIVSIFGFLLLMQGMTNTLLFMAISIAMLLVGGTSPRRLGKVALVYAVIGVLFFAGKEIYESNQLEDLQGTEQVEKDGQMLKRKGTWKSRMQDYFSELTDPHPYTNPDILDNDQKLYSYLAQANGGIIGEGPGSSRETSRLPLAFSDYVYSIVVEDLGFVGGIFLLITFFTLMFRAGRIANQCDRAYPALLTMGMAMVIVMQAFFHMAINTGVFPVSGQNLPLISKGGTSIIMICIAFGVMMSVSRSVAEGKLGKKNPNSALPDNINAINPTKQV